MELSSDLKKILIVEDDAPTRRLLADFFSSAGFEVVLASNGEEGFKCAQNEKPDVILLEVTLPKLDGMGLIKKIREQGWGGSVPIIVYSNFLDVHQVLEAVQHGVCDFLVKKDWKINEVVLKVRERLHKPRIIHYAPSNN